MLIFISESPSLKQDEVTLVSIGVVMTEKWHSYQVCAPCPQTDKTLKMAASENKVLQIILKSFLIQKENTLTVSRKLENNVQAQTLFLRHVLKFIHDVFGNLWGASFSTQSI